jgi:hypothetical protein
MRQKTEQGAVPMDNRDPVEIRVIRDQKEVRAVLGDTLMNDLLHEASWVKFVFLVFTDEGKGTAWLTDREEQDPNSDDDAMTVRKRISKFYGRETENRLWLIAKKLKGWTD